ncbi:hypothetical protein CFP56_014364 [Quercus suber]|uniref:Secreted protein n=1 Tax=Quercus suber TaxID=58331 RepID=A0AAW0KVK5_QUESU
MQMLCAYVLVRMVLLASLLEPHLHCLLMVYYCTLNKMMSCKCGPDFGDDVFVLISIGRYLQLLCFVIANLLVFQRQVIGSIKSICHILVLKKKIKN